VNGPERMNGPDHSRWEDERAAYLLGALDEDERAAFEAHLADCDRCRAELRWLQPAIDVLPAAVEQHEPPSGLRQRVLDAVGGDAPAGAAVGRDRPPARRRFWSRVPVHPALAGLALLLALAVGAAAGYLLRGDSDESPSGRAASAIPVKATPLAVDATGKIVHHEDSWTLDVSHMPQLRRGEIYQVWMRRGKQVWPSVVFVLSRDGRASVLLPYEAADRADTMLVTREPGGGRRAPTSAPLVWAALE
jgi:anti-sigma-K factor RskA